ncbi:MAG: hypothetical protein ACKO5K_11860 [Armatimonadota bacterium]
MRRLRNLVPFLALLMAWATVGTAVVRAAHVAQHATMAAGVDGHCLACAAVGEPLATPGSGATSCFPPGTIALAGPLPENGLRFVAPTRVLLPPLRAPPVLFA